MIQIAVVACQQQTGIFDGLVAACSARFVGDNYGTLVGYFVSMAFLVGQVAYHAISVLVRFDGERSACDVEAVSYGIPLIVGLIDVAIAFLECELGVAVLCVELIGTLRNGRIHDVVGKGSVKVQYDLIACALGLAVLIEFDVGELYHVVARRLCGPCNGVILPHAGGGLHPCLVVGLGQQSRFHAQGGYFAEHRTVRGGGENDIGTFRIQWRQSDRSGLFGADLHAVFQNGFGRGLLYLYVLFHFGVEVGAFLGFVRRADEQSK